MVKFRIKLNKRTFTVDLKPNDGTQSEEGVAPNNGLTLGYLRHEIEHNESISNSLNGCEFEISLNGKDALDGDDKSLTELGVVAGDLIRLIMLDSASQCAPDLKRRNVGALDRPGTSDNATQGEKLPRTAQSDMDIEDSGASVSKTGNQQASTSAAEYEMEHDIVYNDEDTVQDNEALVLLNEPVLVCESYAGHVPLSLSMTYDSEELLSNHQALFVVLHVLMREGGFNSSSQTYAMPEGWKKPGGVFKAQYTVSGYTDSIVSLTYVVLGNVANVLCRVCDSDIRHQLKLTPADYIISLSQNARNTYKNLVHLSTLFRDKISYPVQQNIRAGSESPLPSLTNLMAEVQHMILMHLSAKDLLNLSAVCRHFNTIAKATVLWRRLYIKDFGRRVDNNDLTRDWLKLYKDKFILRQQMRENYRLMRTQMIPPPFRDPYADPNPLHPGSGYPPGFVGGDYDRDPHFGGLPGVFGPGGNVGPGVMLPRPRYDPIGPHPDMRRPQRPPLPGWDPSSRTNRRRDPDFGGGGGFGFM